LIRDPIELPSEDDFKSSPNSFALPASASVVINYTGLNAAKLAINMLAWFLCASALDPTEMGYWTIFSLVIVYGPFCAAGVLSGLGRELPHEIGAGRITTALDLAGAASWLAWRLAFVFALAVAGFAIYVAVSEMAPWYVALAYGGIGALVFPTYHSRVLLRTAQKFQSLGLRELAASMVGLALVIFVYWFGLVGMAVRGLGIAVANTVSVSWRRPYAVTSKKDWPKLFHLSRVGLPIDGVTFAHSLVESLDVALLAIFGGPASVGLYALARATMTGLRVLPISVGTIYYPKMCDVLGRTGELKSQLPLIAGALGFLLLISLPAAFLVTSLLEYVVPLFLPKYVAGLEAAQWVVWAIVAGFASPLGDLFTALRRLDLYFAAIVIGGFAFVFSFVFLLSEGVLAYVAAAQAVLIRAAMTSLTQILLTIYLFVKPKSE